VITFFYLLVTLKPFFQNQGILRYPVLPKHAWEYHADQAVRDGGQACHFLKRLFTLSRCPWAPDREWFLFMTMFMCRRCVSLHLCRRRHRSGTIVLVKRPANAPSSTPVLGLLLPPSRDRLFSRRHLARSAVFASPSGSTVLTPPQPVEGLSCIHDPDRLDCPYSVQCLLQAADLRKLTICVWVVLSLRGFSIVKC
jgi:hypothetical protein